MAATDELLSVRAAELYYEEDKTQDEIGSVLGVTRWKVGRLLSRAKVNGFVRVEIVHPRARRPVLERRLREERGLSDAVVVSVAGVTGEEEIQQRTAQAAADYLTALVPASDLIGVSWGRTLHEVSDRLRPGWAVSTSVVQINGGVSRSGRPDIAAATAVAIAHKGGGSATLLPSPAIFERSGTKRALEADRAVVQVLDLARSAAVYVYSAGVADHDSVHVASGYLSTADIDGLVARGAVGDVVGRYIDERGQIVDPVLNERTLGLGLDELSKAKTGVAVIAGARKRAIARAVVVSGLCSALVTDETTALHVLGSELRQ